MGYDFKSYRHRLGLTQEQLARELDTSLRTIVAQENSPRPRKLYIFAMERLIIHKEHGESVNRFLEKLLGEQK